MTQVKNPLLSALKHQLASVYKGSPDVIDNLLVALLCQGHLLLEDVPGLGKTTLAKALTKSLSLSFNRVQCTPDLMPSDILGGNIYQQNEQSFKFLPGPIFANLVLVDEINRASPRAQSAFLEAMAEGAVTIDRETVQLPSPFMVIATQNPIEFAGTFPLPEAQLDRFFMRVSLGYPTADQSLDILNGHLQQEPIHSVRPIINKDTLLQWQKACLDVQIIDDVKKYIVAFIEATRNHKDVRLGASPRAAIALMHAARADAYLKGAQYVTPQHVQSVAYAVLGHRLVLRGGQNIARGQKIIEELLQTVPVIAVAVNNSAAPVAVAPAAK